MMKLNEMIIELYQMPDRELAEIRSRKNGHIDHIAFDVDDIDTTFADTKKAMGFHYRRSNPYFFLFGKMDVNISI